VTESCNILLSREVTDSEGEWLWVDGQWSLHYTAYITSPVISYNDEHGWQYCEES